jgi:hypothetical protein
MRAILLLYVFLGFSLFPLSGQQIACHDSIGIPCSTITYKSSQWKMVKLAAGLFTHETMQQTFAHRSDGSAVSVGSSFIELYSASTDQVVRVNNVQKTVSHRQPIIWHDRPYRLSEDGDSSCATAIHHRGGDFHMTGDLDIQGIPVKVWERGDGWYWHQEEYLAPSLDCASLKSYTIRRNQFLIPTFINTLEAVSVRVGEPDQRLFSVPRGYREVTDPREKWLREFVVRNGSGR